MTDTADEGFGAHPFGTRPEAFGGLVQSWNDAFLRLLEAAPGAQPKRPARDQ